MHRFSQFHTVIVILLSSVLTLSSCNNNKSAEKEEINSPIPVMTEVPSFISDKESAQNYLALHFWDNTDTQDTLYLKNPRKLRIFFLKYLQHLRDIDSSIAAQSLKKWTKKIVQSPQNMQDFMLQLAEKTLYDPNSPVRNETLYISILEVLSTDSSLLPIIRQRYRDQLHIAKQNRPGEKANDFVMVNSEGKKISLHNFKGKYTLIMFYEPTCPACEVALNILDNNETFKKVKSKINLLAVYTGENLQEWRENIYKFKPTWNVTHDLHMEIITRKLYDRRPSPSFYLLDQNHIVLLKDGTTSQLLSMLNKL